MEEILTRFISNLLGRLTGPLTRRLLLGQGDQKSQIDCCASACISR